MLFLGLMFGSVSLVGCVAMGFIDDEKFLSAIKNGQCDQANVMNARSNFGSQEEMWSYMGHMEYFCYKNRGEGIRLLRKAATYGDSWAKITLAKVGEKLPENYISGRGGVPTININVNK